MMTMRTDVPQLVCVHVRVTDPVTALSRKQYVVTETLTTLRWRDGSSASLTFHCGNGEQGHGEGECDEQCLTLL